MINGFHFLVAVAVIFGFVVVLPWARRRDAHDEHHLLHGPDSGCMECVGK